MRALFRFEDAARPNPQVSRWLSDHRGPLGDMAQRWFEIMRNCGKDVTEVLHDGQPTVCVAGSAFAYVDIFSAHVNIGFFQGADLPDPEGLLEGSGSLMRHVKLRPDEPVNVAAVSALIGAAYLDVKERLTVSEQSPA